MEAEEPNDASSPTSQRHSKRESYKRLSKLPDDTRNSIQSIQTIRLVPDRGNESNRSSATTFKGQPNGAGGLSDLEFDKALKKFATDRESFLQDLTLSAGVVVSNRPTRPRLPKAQKIVNDEVTPTKSRVGSIRRRISMKDMNSVKRQPSVVRQGETMGQASLCRVITSHRQGLIESHSFHSHSQTTEQLQFCNPQSTATQY